MIISVTLDEMHRYVYRNFNEAQSFHFSPLLKLFLFCFFVDDEKRSFELENTSNVAS